MAYYPQPQLGASLLLSFSAPSTSLNPPTVLLVSPNRISALRAFAALEAGFHVVVAASESDVWDPELESRRESGQVESLACELTHGATYDEWAHWLDSFAPGIKQSIHFIVLNDTVPGLDRVQGGRKRRTYVSALAFKKATAERRYLVNIADAPLLSDFSWPITHRFDLASNAAPSQESKSPLQLALTTNSSACRLASRLRREIVSSLPQNIGSAVLAISTLRASLASPDYDVPIAATTISEEPLSDAEEGAWPDSSSDADEDETLNKPVQQLTVVKGQELDRVGFGGRSRRTQGHKDEADRALSPCRARQLSRSRSRARNGKSDDGTAS